MSRPRRAAAVKALAQLPPPRVCADTHPSRCEPLLCLCSRFNCKDKLNSYIPPSCSFSASRLAWGILRPELDNRDLRSPDPQLLAYSRSLMAHHMRRNNTNAKFCLSYFLAYERLSLEQQARSVDGLVGTTEGVCSIFPTALSISSIQL